MAGKKISSLILILTLMAILIVTCAVLEAETNPLTQTELPQPKIPEPQSFCGYCHVLTYPNIITKGYETWKTDKHNKYACIECHYPPVKGKTVTEITHIPKKPPERFSYLPLGGETVLTRPRIVDASCMTADCHGKPEDKFKTKKIKFTEKVPFVHQPHLEKKNQIEGQQVNCTSCHQHETPEKHFQVAKASCQLCHFKNTKFNEGRGKCNLCHELPKKPIQTSGQKPITHEILEKAKVSCGSCHYDLIQAAGGATYEAFFEDNVLKTTLVLGAGRTKKENCLACHDKEKDLKESGNKKLMHEKHVTLKNSRCLDCHRPIGHTKVDLNQLLKEHSTQERCSACHADPHHYQRLLIAGAERKGVMGAPDPMHKVRADCMACHAEKTIGERGNRVMKATGKTCVACHTKDHQKMLEGWKAELARETKFAKETEQRAVEALAKKESTLTPAKLAEVRKALHEGQENLRLVLYGNGIHNRKYSMLLIDAAINKFEDLIDDLQKD